MTELLRCPECNRAPKITPMQGGRWRVACSREWHLHVDAGCPADAKEYWNESVVFQKEMRP